MHWTRPKSRDLASPTRAKTWSWCAASQSTGMPARLVPFRGIAHVAYVRGGRLHGFGRIARMVDAIDHRPTYQEWMTRDVADALVRHDLARGAACIIEAEQLCLLLGENRRGGERVHAQAFVGCLETDGQLRAEFLRAIGMRNP
jgi:GTP cyclohydrolase I